MDGTGKFSVRCRNEMSRAVHPAIPWRVPLQRPPTRWLRLFRPATLDLILTKMMRGDDAQDMADIGFLIQHDAITAAQIEMALDEAVIPDLAELREAFEQAKPRVRDLARSG